MNIKILSVLIILFVFLNTTVRAQESSSGIYRFKYDFLKNRISEDTLTKTGKSKVQKANIGGLFISPYVGVAFPLGNFGNYSKTGIAYGAKFELAYSRLYPFIFGFVYENQKNKGDAEFTTTNFLTQFDTEILSFGGSVDLLLNKYIKSDFTAPVFTVEVKFAKVKKTVTPDNLVPEIPREESLLTYSAGLAFTIYVLDLGGKYTFAKDYSNLSFSARIHIPVIKF